MRLSIPLNQLKVEIPLKAEEPKKVVINVKQYVNEYFKEIPILAEVAKCESRFRMWEKDGSVFKGRITPDDKGVMQINEYWNGKEAKRLGYDINTLEGNLGFALHLYRTQGLQPWSASSGCWSQALTVRNV